MKVENDLIDPEMKKSMQEIEETCHKAGHQLGSWQEEGRSQFSNKCGNNGCGLVVGVRKLEGYDGMVFRTIGRYGFPGKCAPN